MSDAKMSGVECECCGYIVSESETLTGSLCERCTKNEATYKAMTMPTKKYMVQMWIPETEEWVPAFDGVRGTFSDESASTFDSMPEAVQAKADFAEYSNLTTRVITL